MKESDEKARYHYSFENSLYSVEAYSVIGTGERQEDAVDCIVEEMSAVLIVCDGMGGLEQGRTAAKRAAAVVKQLALEQDWKSRPRQFLSKAIEIADEEVYFLKNADGDKISAGCTIIIALVLGREVFYANVGDSRIYHYNGVDFLKLTQDHNYGELLKKKRKNGEIGEDEYQRELSKAAALTSYLGLGELKEFYIAEEPVLLDRNHVLCLQTDGLYKLLSNEEMKEIIKKNAKDLKKIGENLLNRAEANRVSYQDNTSFILLRLK